MQLSHLCSYTETFMYKVYLSVLLIMSNPILLSALHVNTSPAVALVIIILDTFPLY